MVRFLVVGFPELQEVLWNRDAEVAGAGVIEFVIDFGHQLKGNASR
jgi:hypothetical protein